MRVDHIPVGVMFTYKGGLFLRIKDVGSMVNALVIAPIVADDPDIVPIEALETTPFNKHTEVEVYEGS